MNSQRNTLKAFTDAAADAVARAIASVQREAQQEREVRAAEHRARMAELDLIVAEVRSLERQVADRLANLKDGAPGQPGEPGQPGPVGADADMVVVRAMIDEFVAAAVAEIPPAPAGKDADPAVIAEMVAEAVSQIPPAASGKDADPELVRSMVDEAIAALPPAQRGEPGEPGREGPAGKLPTVKDWIDDVHYEGSVVTHEGATYQANRDTGRAPPHDDWRCIARAGRDGRDGRTFRICGTYAEGGEHLALDVVVLNGASFVAKHDAPGRCPGEGWQMIAAQGKRGNPGEKGDPGKKGDPGVGGPAVRAAVVDGEGVVTLTNADGSTVECDLYPVLSKVLR